VGESSPLRHLFVYGTLRPGDVRWHILEPFVIGEGSPDTVSGELFDTGLDYPAAIFGQAGTIHGRTYELHLISVDRCLAVLDHVEDTVDGLYRRVEVATGDGSSAWSYAYGAGLQLSPIPSGDWLAHRPPQR
jgi:gamma-glutamylcyclotransferase (GGCT)/AIG2-like uncharacterized protein YtfP